MVDVINKIEYGNGEVFIDIGEDVIGFDILLSGLYELESVDITNFIMKYHNHRIIGVGLGSKLGKQAFLKYTGDLRILKCVVVKDNMEKKQLYIDYRDDKFSTTFDDFDGTNTKFEDMNNSNIHGDIPSKIKTTFLNDKIYDINGKKLEIDQISNTNIITVLKAVSAIKTTSTTGGGY